ncbi:ABC transporter permease [Pseudogemmobacter humi]|uniref:Inner membrane ABC transporter permease protein YdcV n=1 Tax=Pseudogemmobacter humi TaxID=2483812 RepID=A0A3P5WWF5_9RHOB|nr:ABC transporter permease [Pseudogemmobacter humi]VDC23420.1 Inner membrane ABC transporter permease protein YdcV [Pseudogemmobacter humi]
MSAQAPLHRLAALLPRVLFALYMAAFLIYLFLPLAIMSAATFNTSRFPTVTPWLGTTLQWFQALWNDQAMWKALWLSIGIGLAVVAFALPVGTAAALFLTSMNARARSFFYAVMVSPLLTPGVAIGIATLILWRQAGVSGGTMLIVLAQSTFITAYVMLMVVARLQRFDRTQEEAALGLGASRWMIFRRVLLPFLKPALIAAGFIAFLQSFENYNTTLFVRGTDTPLTVYIATKVRTGLTPAVNALALILIALTLVTAVVLELSRRRKERHQPG